jgi:microcystin-dependent protein
MDPFIGQIVLWPLTWAPDGWAFCNGQILQVSQYQALYSLIGNTYGGTANSTFGLPNLNGRVPIGATNNQPNLGTVQGAASVTVTSTGACSATITSANLPQHTHTATFSPSGTPSNVSVAIPAVPAPVNTTDTPGPTTRLAKGVPQGPDNVNTYSTDTATSNLAPFNISVPASGGSVAVAAGGGSATPSPLNLPVSVQGTLSTMQPSLTLNFIIALTGIYPPRP